MTCRAVLSCALVGASLVLADAGNAQIRNFRNPVGRRVEAPTLTVNDKVQQLTERVSGIPEYSEDAARLRELSAQYDGIAADVSALEAAVSSQGRTPESDEMGKRLMATLARQRADTQALARKRQRRDEQIKKDALSSAKDNLAAERELFQEVLRVFMEAQERETQVLLKLTS